MWTSYLTGLVALAVVLAAWLAVQHAWRAVFAGASEDPDALAGRLGCHGICPTQPCPRRCPERSNSEEENES